MYRQGGYIVIILNKRVIWDKKKNETLKLERGLSFEVFAEMIIARDY